MTRDTEGKRINPSLETETLEGFDRSMSGGDKNRHKKWQGSSRQSTHVDKGLGGVKHMENSRGSILMVKNMPGGKKRGDLEDKREPVKQNLVV